MGRLTCDGCCAMRSIHLYGAGVMFVCDNGEEELHEVDPFDDMCETGLNLTYSGDTDEHIRTE